MTSGAGDARRGASVRSYRTSFGLDEDPISEGGIWLNGGEDGLDWPNVGTRNGLAHGAATSSTIYSPAPEATSPLDECARSTRGSAEGAADGDHSGRRRLDASRDGQRLIWSLT